MDGIRPAAGLLEKLLDRYQSHYWFAKRFGWPESTVDEQGALYLDAMRMIGEVEDEVIADARRKQQPQQGQGAR